MEFNFDFSFNVINIVTGILAWGIIGILAYRFYNKQSVKLKGWKVIVAILVGIFSFSINWNLLETMVKIPLLPLGVWILYLVKGRKERWKYYRSFAWLGFFANFIFLVSTLIAIPVHHALYPEDELSTFISNAEKASIIHLHPSAMDRPLNKGNLLKLLKTMKPEKIYSDQWYQEMNTNFEPSKSNERFPYQLTGTSSKWGSGLDTIIYIEEDGKGVLISTPKKQHYFHSQDSILEGGK
ncbi:hypothetical protein [Neobacillus soli]|uniref:hypothetical protein n=1 Tax=Neobacillus soli TaxID=220688 RepID=UPI000826625B|nr:hypothetical protein [Neobacillus soli]